MVESKEIAEHDLDSGSWATNRHRTHRRTTLSAIQIAGSAIVMGYAIILAFLMLRGWPSEAYAISSGPFAFPARIFAVIRSTEFAPYLALVVLSPLVHLLIFQWLNLYRVNLSDIRPFGETLTVLRGAILGTIVLVMLASAYKNPQAASRTENYPLLFFIYNGLLVFFGTLLFHSGTLLIVIFLHGLGIWRTRVAIIHSGNCPEDLVASLLAPTSGYRLRGVIRMNDSIEAEMNDQVPDLGILDELSFYINSYNLDEVILTVDPGSLSTEQRLNVAQTCWRMGVTLKMLTPFHPFFRTSAHPETVGDVTLLNVENVGLYATTPQILKRTMDIVVSLTALILVSPFMIATMIIVKLDSPGPMFFVQERVGLNGRTFRMFKFRSMRTDADDSAHKEYLKQLISSDAAHDVDKDGNPIFKIVKDPRVTKFGYFIRKTSIDELPQIFNVLLGTMSLVGPRPPIQYEVDEYKDWHMKRLAIRPGITGLWQVSGRNRLSFDQMVELDINYIENWSLLTDVSILFRTIPVLLKIEQAH